MTSERPKYQEERYTARQLRTLSARTLQLMQHCIARYDVRPMGIQWRTHLFIEWPAGGDLVIRYA